jgi:signal recognition particle subunit SEC65
LVVIKHGSHPFPLYALPLMAAPFSLTPRTLNFETSLEGEAVVVLPPRGAAKSEFAQAVLARLAELGADARIEPYAENRSLAEFSQPVVVWGNLANSDAVRELYFKCLVMTDLRYPGAGGHELRTLIDPYGTGANILYLGYSDDAGLQSGGDRFLARLAPRTPLLNDIQANGLPITDFQVQMIRDSSFPPLDWMITADPHITHKGYLAFLTGEAQLQSQAREVWERVVAYGVPPGDHNIKDLHLRTSMLVSVFRLQETAGLVPEDLRGPILNYLIEWVYSDQGIVKMDIPENTAPGVQRQNHGTIPALALAYLSAYLRDFYPERSEPAEWDLLIDRIFEPYADGSWKNASEGICHGWWLEQPVLLEYGLLDQQHRYFNHEGARRAADCAIAVTNNFGWLSSSGDVNLTRAFAGVSLRTAAAWYRDPRYTFVHNLAPDFHALRMHQFLSRTFDIGLGVEEPEAGLTLIPLDPIVHHGATHHRDIAPWMFERAPSAPVEQCFDKVAFRTGWTPDDTYLLIDGIGGGSHAYADALDLVEYSRLGFSFLISETGPKFPETDHHAVVTVARDGVSDAIPCFATWEEATWDESARTGYARLVLSGNNGATWTRELFLLNAQGLIIHDHVCAESEGDYTIQSNLRTPGLVSWEGGRTVARRRQGDGTEVVFGLQPLGPAGAPPHVVERDHSVHIRPRHDLVDPRPEDDNVAAWERRYGIKETVVSITRMRAHTHLAKGEGISFIHYAHARHPNEADPRLCVEGSDTLRLQGLDAPVEVKTHRPIELKAESIISADPEKPWPIAVRSFAETAGEAVKTLVPLGDGSVVVAMEAGTVRALDASGEAHWETALAGPVHDVDAGAELAFVGHGDCALTALRLADGAIAWTYEIERIPSSCSWWEWPTPAAFEVVAARPDSGFDGVVAGCGDIQMRCFDAAGNCRWNYRYVNGIPGTIRLVDVNGDGVDEIMVGGEVMSNCSHCRVVDSRGRQLQQLEVEGWTSRMTALAVAKGEPTYLAFGATRGRNLYFLAIDPAAEDPLQVRWMRRMPGAVTAVHIDPAHERVVVGNTLGLIVAFDFDGQPTGRLALPAGVQSIWGGVHGYLVGLEDGMGHLVQLDVTAGLTQVAQWEAAARWGRVAATADGVLIPTAHEILHLPL